MTEIEKKAEEYTEKKTRGTLLTIYAIDSIYRAYKDGYEQGKKDNDNYILPAIEQKNEIINQLEKENEELKEKIKEMKSDLFKVINQDLQEDRLCKLWEMAHKYLDNGSYQNDNDI